MAWRDRWLLKSDYRRNYVEGIIVIIMLTVAILVIFLLFFRSAKTANKAICLAHLKQLYQAMSLYSFDYDGMYPPTDRWAIGLASYTDNLNSFTCPEDKGIRLKNKPKYDISSVSYWYIQPKSEKAETAICGDRVYSNLDGNHVDGGNVLYADGHARWVKSENWASEDLPFSSFADDKSTDSKKKTKK